MRPVIMIALPIVAMSATPGWTQPVCKPTLAFTDAHYTPMQLPKRERTWTVAFSVDASRCAMDSGSFSILFTVWRENAPDTEYVETFQWKHDLNVISRNFWADEAVGAYRVIEVQPCLCADQSKK